MFCIAIDKLIHTSLSLFFLEFLAHFPIRFYFSVNSVSFRFGAITMASGIIGVPLGTYVAQRLKKSAPRADPIICAVGLITSAPLLAGSMLIVSANATWAYILVFLGSVALNLNWAIVADILLVRIIAEANMSTMWPNTHMIYNNKAPIIRKQRTWILLWWRVFQFFSFTINLL